MTHSRTTFTLMVSLGLIATTLSGCFPLAVTGATSAALVAGDRRTTGVYLDDEGIEWKAMSRINEKLKRDDFHVNIISYNRQVLITGEVPNDAVKEEISALVRSVDNVGKVLNETVLAPISGFASRGADGAITAQVKTRFVGNKVFSPVHVKVITEANTVFLLGLVTREEASTAVEIARTTKGVQRVIQAFEYVKRAE